eukprot:scaffold3017_cov81-Cylindrotheca_fusiformis.AAC.3
MKAELNDVCQNKLLYSRLACLTRLSFSAQLPNPQMSVRPTAQEVLPDMLSPHRCENENPTLHMMRCLLVSELHFGGLLCCGAWFRYFELFQTRVGQTKL